MSSAPPLDVATLDNEERLRLRSLLDTLFIEVSHWVGPKNGYVFKTGRQGLGYYVDRPPEAPASKIGHLFVTADSMPLFGEWFSTEVKPAIERYVHQQQQEQGVRTFTAAYVGASNGDLVEYFDMFTMAVEGLKLSYISCVHVKASELGSVVDSKRVIKDAALIVLAGGDVHLGWRSMQACGLDVAVRDASALGAVIVGISAGAIHMGAYGYTGEEDKYVEPFATLALVPLIFGAHEEQDAWLTLRKAFDAFSAARASRQGASGQAVGVGIQTGGAATLHYDGSLEPSLKDAVVILQSGPRSSEVARQLECGEWHNGASPVPICFLDVEGVMVCNERKLFEQEKLEELARMTEACPGLRFVITSSWRKDTQKKRSAVKGLTHEMFGLELAEPDATPVHHTPFEEDAHLCRPREILAWLQQQKSMNVGAWVVIDSHDLTRMDGGDCMQGQFVRTDAAQGLTQERADAAIERLVHGPRSRLLELGYIYGVEESDHHDWCMHSCVPKK